MATDTDWVLPKERVITPTRGWVGIDFAELWRYRELFVFMAWRNILVRYKQTAIGVLWAIIRPVMMMLVFTLVFDKLAQLPSRGVPYPVLTFAALLPWQFFSQSVRESSNSLVQNRGMIAKIYFPRLIAPLSTILSGIIDFAISFVVLVGLMMWYGVSPTLAVLCLPAFFLLAVISSSGLGLWFSALNVEYRDVKHAIPFLIQFGIYISPVGFSSSVVPEEWRLLYSINPMVGVIEGFRWSLLGSEMPISSFGLGLSVGVAVAVFLSGALYFKRMESRFADVI
jgi:lipopolysaccharide transport system permease protein